ncbi:conserved Plasmodium protein, unknown function [Plasmodium knowlesi strain H]|uniref:Uncharacterized protein n=3 Tax=Plasmodium knowlesi TaxID=5850 RepID=A0A1A7VR20_PLAKH|nr:conserved Plasmodium protein, unknown function [Plasmodium knowlesi strain H]OTN66408.1 Uncharacterized protein PKNOH_S09547000 [Plasmodium knowlesi]CAA9989844.1 conserved Plasmodium protein, unknown function [Plasmodium knowlesi strain H]SBO24396.1 conserved Plasmodium protein, unknown function [Plasmodium knowlesi strain H]SBO26618.1 conserved Plasmodium protein, unknown function [Plasmodium knowlesi strain H]VVS79318.1 conserved Plasmodium protein, unknown function [Plasmodium knowlesi s
MKLLYICDTRFCTFNSREKKYLFKYWAYSLQDLLNNSSQRNIRLWLVCINLIDYLDVLTFSDPFDYGNVKRALENISPHFDLSEKNSRHGNDMAVDPLIAFLRNSENRATIKECDKVAILSCNIHQWEDKVPELKLFADEFRTSVCKFYLFNVHKSAADGKNKLPQLGSALGEYPNFFLKNVLLNKINILQISKEILSITFVVSFTLSLQNELVLKCEGRPLVEEVGHSAFIGLSKFPVVFDIRAKALKEGISQHLIYGIPIFLSDIHGGEGNLISLERLSRELHENEQVIILRSNINPTDLKTHEKEVRFLWVGTPMTKSGMSVALCLHGLATQETYSLSIEEYYKEHVEEKNEHISDTKIRDLFNFLILLDEFNPLDYSNERFQYSFKYVRDSLMSLPPKNVLSKKSNRKKKTTLLKYAALEDVPTGAENAMPLGGRGNLATRRKKQSTKSREILDPRSLLLANMNKAFQKNII